MIRFKIPILTLSLFAIARLVVKICDPSCPSPNQHDHAIAKALFRYLYWSPGNLRVCVCVWWCGGAAVRAINLANGLTLTAATGPSGEYRFSQLSPGRYSISVAAAGFEKTTLTVDLSPGTIATVNVATTVGKDSITVEVNGSEVPLLHGDDAQITTTFTQHQILLLPNPGNDITFLAQLAPGSIMNTQSGFGNFASFDCPERPTRCRSTADTITSQCATRSTRGPRTCCWAQTTLLRSQSLPMLTMRRSAVWAERRYHSDPLRRKPVPWQCGLLVEWPGD